MSVAIIQDTLPQLDLANGFARIAADDIREMAGPEAMAEWPLFRASWDDLERDEYMADGGTYRRRSFSVFKLGPERLHRKTHRPHFQGRQYNPLNGGLERWFMPTDAALTDGLLIPALLRSARDLFSPDGTNGHWLAELHQFRIEARADGPGHPTPEGLHRDGVDWVFMMAVERFGVTGGVSHIHANDGTPLAEFTLIEPGDAVLLDDRRVLHGVTPIHPADGDKPGHRDLLVVTYRRIEG